MKTTILAVFLLFCLVALNSCQKTMSVRDNEAFAIIGSAVANEIITSTFKVSGVFSDNMVIQRDKPAAVWGTAPAGNTISVKASWNTNTFTTVANSSNQWQVPIPATPANTNPQQLLITDSAATITFSNILIGDVWVCSGQSNMVMPVDSVGVPYKGFEGVINYKQEIAAANWPLLRLATVQAHPETKPLYDLDTLAPWTVCDPNTVKAYSAVAYFFGRKIMTTLNVPVGLVVSAVGGSSCQQWTNKSKLQVDPVLKDYYGTDSECSNLYNGMINPLKQLSIKGFIWYQGERNRYDEPASNYTRLNTAMIKGWRNEFAQGALPFYYVQMTPYDISKGTANATDDDYAFFREAQANVRQLSNTGMAVTMDVGDVARIHPRDKKPVGERLALLALHKTYELVVKDVGPQYASCTINNYVATINFAAGTAIGLNTINGAPLGQYFFVAGTDSIFRQGSATIRNNKMVVTAPQNTPLPVLSVRYAFTNFPITNLQKGAGLPMEPFRTDTWPGY